MRIHRFVVPAGSVGSFIEGRILKVALNGVAEEALIVLVQPGPTDDWITVHLDYEIPATQKVAAQ
jgi:hypothetical protein